MTILIFEDLLKACTSGGASTLVSVTELEPAAGAHASVAPAKFVDGRSSVFAFETRFIDGAAARVVLLDSKQSQLNRAEDSIMQDIRAEHPLLGKIPRILVTYSDGQKFSDMELPHRFADGHFRAGTIDGEMATANEKYRALRNSTPADMSAILNTAPASAIFGAWDSTRKKNQVRLRSALVGEIIGVLADQGSDGQYQQSRRGGARLDTVAMSVQLEPKDMGKLIDSLGAELSDNNVDKLRGEIKKAKKDKRLSASGLGLGGIPPRLDGLDGLGGVACSRIIRSWVLSFAALRQLRFGGSEEANVAGRALLAAFGLVAISRAERELYLRANCDLVEAGAPVVTLDERYGNKRTLDPITVELADQLLQQAIDHARSTGLADWNGQILHVDGNPLILEGASDESESGD